jgi:hypothetical protein
MSSLGQAVTVLAFLAYSVAYFMFIAWAAERADGANHPRRLPGLAAHLVGLALPLTGLLLLLLRT